MAAVYYNLRQVYYILRQILQFTSLLHFTALQHFNAENFHFRWRTKTPGVTLLLTFISAFLAAKNARPLIHNHMNNCGRQNY